MENKLKKYLQFLRSYKDLVGKALNWNYVVFPYIGSLSSAVLEYGCMSLADSWEQ